MMSFPIRRWGLFLCLIVGLFTVACTNTQPSTDEAITADSVEEAATAGATETAAALPEGLPSLQGKATIEMKINGGRVVIEVDGDAAPVTAGNFVDLVERGVYDGLVFHRVIKSPDPFVAQGGDPQSADSSVPPQALGTGSFIDPETQQPRLIPLEIQPADADEPLYSQTFESAGVSSAPALPHRRGAVAMARSQLPDSASSQFYIALADLPFLDGSYAVFGYVVEGMDVVDGIEQGDVIESATVIEGADNLRQPE